MFSFQGASLSFLLRSSMKHQRLLLFQSTSYLSSCVVEISGIEPLTSCLQGRRSPSWAKPPYFHITIFEVVGQNGLEPSTSRLSVVCSSQLSYWPIWWRLAGSNRWPPACKAGALPAELNPRSLFHLLRCIVFLTIPSKLNNASTPKCISHWP